MRVLQLTPGYAPEVGGIERHVQRLSEELAGTGHEVTVATASSPGVAADETGPVRVLRFPARGPRAYRCAPGLLAFLARNSSSYDLIHAHNFHALPVLMAAVAGRAPLVVSPYLHPHPSSRLAQLLHAAYDPLAIPRLRTRTNRFICLSAGEAALATHRFGVSSAMIHVVPSGLKRSARPAAAPRQPIILSVGRLERYKRVDRLLAALTQLPEPWRLVIIGSGPARQDLVSRARQLGIAERVEFLGRLDDAQLDGWYRRAALVATCSEAESFGIVVLEALAAGCRVLCSDIPSFADFAHEFPAAVSLVPPQATARDIAGLAARLAGAPLPPLDLAPYTWSRVVAAHLSVYRAAIAAATTVPARPVGIGRA